MIEIADGYHGQEYSSTYADVAQKWIVVFSQSAHIRKCKTLKKSYLKCSEQETKDFLKLTRQTFKCREDANKHLSKTVSRYKYVSVGDVEVVEIEKHAGVGRPKQGSQPSVVGYRL